MLKQKGFIWIAAAMMVVLTISVFYENRQGKKEALDYPAFAQAVEKGDIKTVYYSDNANWKAVKTDGEEITVPNPRNADMKEKLLLQGVQVIETQSGNMLPALIFAGVLVFLLFGKRSGMERFSNMETEKAVSGKTFEDVIVAGETLRSMEDLTHYLKYPKQYAAMGARPPRGVLLYGPPGTGKTLIAQALAGETGKPFFAVSGSDFVQVYVGVGASRIRSLFRKARKAGGGVIFIDEIDALGKKRDSGNDEREQTLNALLTEMNGFTDGEGIIVLAATNRPEMLDAALMREGRFDRRIEISLPDREERRRMLSVHTRNKPMAPDADLDALAKKTVLFSGAQLESLVNEAAIRAIRDGKETIGQTHLEQAYIAQTAGDERKMSMTAEEKHLIAVHEAGHALVTRILLPENKLTRVTVIPSNKGAAGYSMSIQKEQLLYTRKELMHRMAAILAGRAAEEMVFGPENVTNGAASDLEKAEQMALQMYRWHMICADGEREAKKQAMDEGKRLAMDTIEKKRPMLNRLIAALMEKETLLEEELQQILTES